MVVLNNWHIININPLVAIKTVDYKQIYIRRWVNGVSPNPLDLTSIDFEHTDNWSHNYYILRDEVRSLTELINKLPKPLIE